MKRNLVKAKLEWAIASQLAKPTGPAVINSRNIFSIPSSPADTTPNPVYTVCGK